MCIRDRWNERDTTNDALFDNGAMPGGLPLDGQAAPDLLQQAGEEQARMPENGGQTQEASLIMLDKYKKHQGR